MIRAATDGDERNYRPAAVPFVFMPGDLVDIADAKIRARVAACIVEWGDQRFYRVEWWHDGDQRSRTLREPPPSPT